MTGFALTDSGEVYATWSDSQRTRESVGLYKLASDSKANTATWFYVTSTANSNDFPGGSRSEHLNKLYGSDGESLVFAVYVDTPMLFWAPPPH